MRIRLEHTANLSARLIQVWMIADALKCLKRPSFIYNHILIENEGNVYEAIDEGVVCCSLAKHFSHKKYRKPYKDEIIDIEFSEAEKARAIAYLNRQVGKKYEFSNFLFHPIKTITGKWKGQKTDNRHYCYELVIRAMNATGKYNLDPFLNPREFYEEIKKPCLHLQSITAS